VSGIEVPDSLYHFLLWNDLEAAIALAEPGESKWLLFDGISSGPDHQQSWLAVESEALAEWIIPYPGLRPASRWYWSAPALRQIHGRFTVVLGAGRCQRGALAGDPGSR
jgi:hypothetical protein